MDIAILSNDSLKIKIKKTTLVADPRSDIAKVDADAIVATDKNIEPKRVNEYRVLINSVGDYEVSGLKIVGQKIDEGITYTFIYESVETLFAKASVLAKMPTDKIKDYSVVIVNVDTDLPNVITSFEPRVIVLYGEKAVDGAKSLGKEDAAKSSKVSFSEDKLPEETEIYVLS